MGKTSNADLLRDLTASQIRTEEAVKTLNLRLFGGDGQKGAIEHLFEHAEQTRKESEQAVQKAADDAKALVLEAKKEADDSHGALSIRVSSVEKKVWYATGFGAALGFVAGLLGHSKT